MGLVRSLFPWVEIGTLSLFCAFMIIAVLIPPPARVLDLVQIGDKYEDISSDDEGAIHGATSLILTNILARCFGAVVLGAALSLLIGFKRRQLIATFVHYIAAVISLALLACGGVLLFYLLVSVMLLFPR